MSDEPPQKDKVCYGIDLRDYNTDQIRSSQKLNLTWLLDFYKAYPDKEHFFIAYFTKLAGTGELKKQIEAGQSEEQIRESWEPALTNYKAIRKKYLLYK
jgi:uncharacterized protein YbbC (DUF1343 family)